MALTKKQREKLRMKFGGRCAYCGCELPEKRLACRPCSGGAPQVRAVYEGCRKAHFQAEIHR